MLERSHCSGKDRYKQFIARRRKAGTYFDYFRDFSRIMSVTEAALVGHLLNYGKVRSNDDDEIWAATKFIRAGLGLDAEQQGELFDRLEGRGFVRVRIDRDRDGRPRRMVRVMFESIEDALTNGTAPPEPAKPSKKQSLQRRFGMGLIP